MGVRAAHESHEVQIRAAHQAGDYARAAGFIVQHYGPGILAFLYDRLQSPSTAEEVFSDFTENLLRGTAHFAFRSTARAWAYAIARNAANDYFRSPARRPGRHVTMDHPAVERIAAQVRTTTAVHLRTEVKNRLRELRKQLCEEDQTLLVLRIDRDMGWDEIAVVILRQDAPPEARRQEAQRLRQRFKRAKERLRALAEAEGLLTSQGRGS